MATRMMQWPLVVIVPGVQPQLFATHLNIVQCLSRKMPAGIEAPIKQVCLSPAAYC
jgi:hypothetical protein